MLQDPGGDLEAPMDTGQLIHLYNPTQPSENILHLEYKPTHPGEIFIHLVYTPLILSCPKSSQAIQTYPPRWNLYSPEINPLLSMPLSLENLINLPWALETSFNWNTPPPPMALRPTGSVPLSTALLPNLILDGYNFFILKKDFRWIHFFMLL